MTELEGWYTIAEAAQYLGMSKRAVEHHAFVSGKLKGETRLGRRLFTQAELDAFKSNPPKRGNPTSRPRRPRTEKTSDG